MSWDDLIISTTSTLYGHVPYLDISQFQGLFGIGCDRVVTRLSQREVFTVGARMDHFGYAILVYPASTDLIFRETGELDCIGFKNFKLSPAPSDE